MATEDQIDCAADALRRFEQSGRMLRNWDDLPATTKKKWRVKAVVVLSAAEHEASRVSALAME